MPKLTAQNWSVIRPWMYGTLHAVLNGLRREAGFPTDFSSDSTETYLYRMPRLFEELCDLGYRPHPQFVFNQLLEVLKRRDPFTYEYLNEVHERLHGHSIEDAYQARRLALIAKETKLAERRARKRRRAGAGKRGPRIDFYSSPAWRKVRYAALRRGNGACCLCGRSTRDHSVVLHVDHIKPRSTHPALALTLSNLQVLCEDCNMGKSNLDDTDWSPIAITAGTC